MTDKIEISDNEMSENLFSYPDDDEVGSEDDSTEDEEGKSLWYFQKDHWLRFEKKGHLTVTKGSTLKILPTGWSQRPKIAPNTPEISRQFLGTI